MEKHVPKAPDRPKTVSPELAEELADIELATAQRKRMEEERKSKEEELKQYRLDTELNKAFEERISQTNSEDPVHKLSPEAQQKLQMILSKNTNDPFLTQYVQEVQEQQQQQPSDFEKMLRFMDYFISSRPPDETVASPRPLPPALPKREKSTRELIADIRADLQSSKK